MRNLLALTICCSLLMACTMSCRTVREVATESRGSTTEYWQLCDSLFIYDLPSDFCKFPGAAIGTLTISAPTDTQKTITTTPSRVIIRHAGMNSRQESETQTKAAEQKRPDSTPKQLSSNHILFLSIVVILVFFATLYISVLVWFSRSYRKS